MFQGLQAFIQFSVTFFSFDVNESDVKERSAPGEGLLDARPDQLPLHVVLLCDVPLSSLLSLSTIRPLLSWARD